MNGTGHSAEIENPRGWYKDPVQPEIFGPLLSTTKFHTNFCEVGGMEDMGESASLSAVHERPNAVRTRTVLGH